MLTLDRGKSGQILAYTKLMLVFLPIVIHQLEVSHVPEIFTWNTSGTRFRIGQFQTLVLKKYLQMHLLAEVFFSLSLSLDVAST
jgi:hypothetical protein